MVSSISKSKPVPAPLAGVMASGRALSGNAVKDSQSITRWLIEHRSWVKRLRFSPNGTACCSHGREPVDRKNE